MFHFPFSRRRHKILSLFLWNGFCFEPSRQKLTQMNVAEIIKVCWNIELHLFLCSRCWLKSWKLVSEVFYDLQSEEFLLIQSRFLHSIRQLESSMKGSGKNIKLVMFRKRTIKTDLTLMKFDFQKNSIEIPREKFQENLHNYFGEGFQFK